MIYIQFTGKGWLTYALVPVVFVVGIVLGLGLDRGSDPKYLGAGIAGVVVAAVGGAVQWLVGRALNGTAPPAGERAEHTTYGIPMELLAPFYPAVGLAMLALAVGSATSPLWGALFLLAALVTVWPLVRAVRQRLRQSPTD